MTTDSEKVAAIAPYTPFARAETVSASVGSYYGSTILEVNLVSGSITVPWKSPNK